MTSNPGFNRRSVLKLAAGSALATLLAACGRDPVTFHNTDVTGAKLGTDLDLTDHEGKARTLSDFKGKVLVVFFGFIQCPDVCPTTLANFSQVMENLGKDADRVQVAFVTIDPERDTAEILKEYVTQFDPRFLGLRGDSDQTARVAKSFKVYYAKVPGKEPGSYSMDHSAGVYIYDPAGNLRLYGRHNADPAETTEDLRKLLV